MKTITEAISKLSSNRGLADFLFILWAGGAALLSYSLVYTLRKPFTAATFDGIEAFGLDTILGYICGSSVSGYGSCRFARVGGYACTHWALARSLPAFRHSYPSDER